MLIDDQLKAFSSHVKHRFWIISDLQQRYPQRATYCMKTAVRDFLSLNSDVDAICYLGDATEGDNIEFIHQMAQMQIDELAKVPSPIYYSVGNHDFDYYHAHKEELGKMCIPFIEYVGNYEQWHVPQNITEMYRIIPVGDVDICMFTDHADPAGTWYTTHGEIRENKQAYPYTAEDYRRITKKIGESGRETITMSHYSFPGGNREAPLFSQYLPLPENVRMHFYGHAHIGDGVWAGKDCYRKLCGIDNQPVFQVNAASLENYRGSAVRSVIAEWYDTGEIGVYFRNHSLSLWDDSLVVRKNEGIRVPVPENL